MWRRFKFIMSLPSIFNLMMALIFTVFAPSAVYADVCVWRDPERTMSRLFPGAKDYETIDRKISGERLKLIEKRLGKELDPGERENWIYYKIRDSRGQTLGYVLTDAEKGEYGAIEIVVGITPDGRIVGVYIQRAREMDKEFRSKEFLAQFAGKTNADPVQAGKDIKGGKTVPVERVAYGVKKVLVMYDELKGESK